MSSKKIGAIIALDGERSFKQSVTNCNRTLAQLKAEMELVRAQSEGQEDDLESLGNRHEVLTRILEAHKKKEEEVEKGLQHSRESYAQMGEKLQDLRDELQQATKKLQEMEEATDSSEEETEQQRKTVAELTAALEKSEKNYKTAADRVQTWETNLVKAKTETAKANNALNENARAMENASGSAEDYADSLDEIQENTDNVSESAQGLTNVFLEVTSRITPTTVGLAALGAALAKTAKESVEFASSAEKSMKKFQSAAGISTESMGKYQDAIKDLYSDDYGENIESVADAMAQIKQITGEIDPSNLKELTENAIALEDIFDMDMQESVRGIDTLMKKFGLTSKQAYDYMAKGAQNGLDKTHELGDNIAEYGQLWSQAGFSAEEMFTILQNGLDAGAYNLDKVNDFVKEFTISLADGRIGENLGSFSEGTADLFQKWQEGKATAKDVFYSVISDLKNATNEQEALTTASTVWSALGEDNAMAVITSLGDVNDAYKEVSGTMNDIKDIGYDTLESKLESLGRKAETEILNPIGEAALPLLKKGIDAAGSAIDVIGKRISPQKTVLQEFIEEIKESNEQVGDMLENSSISMKNAQIDAQKLESYKNTLLELNGVTEKTEYEKYQIKRIVQDLSESIPQLADAWDEESGSIKLTNEQITALIGNQEAYIIQSAAIEAKEESMKALFEAEMNVAKAESAYNEAAQKSDEVIKKNNESIESTGIAIDGYEYKLSRALATEDEARDALDEAAKAQKKAKEEVDNTTAAADAAAQKIEEYGITLDTTTASSEEMASAQEDASSSIDESANIISDATVRIAEKYVSMRDTMIGSIQNQMDMFAEYSAGTEISTQQLLDNMQSQINGVTNWADNMETLARKGINDGLLEHLAELGPQGANYVQAFVDMTPGQLEKANELWAESLDFKTGTAEAVDSAIETYTEGISGGTDKIQQAMKELGTNSWEGFKQGITEKEGEAEAAGTELGEALIKGTAEGTGVHSPSWKTAQQGRYVAEGLKEGIESGSPEVTAAAKDMASKLIETSKEVLDKDGFIAIGKNITTGLQSGINKGRPYTIAAIRKLLQEIRNMSATGTAQEKYAPYGRNIAIGLRNGISAASQYPVISLRGIMNQIRDISNNAPNLYNTGWNLSIGLANGITAGSSSVINAVANMCQAAVNEARSRLDIHSPSRVFAELGAYTAEGFGIGYETKIADVNGMIRESMDYSDMLRKPTAGGRTGTYSEDAVDALMEYLPYLQIIAEKKYMAYVDQNQAADALSDKISNNTVLRTRRMR